MYCNAICLTMVQQSVTAFLSNAYFSIIYIFYIKKTQQHFEKQKLRLPFNVHIFHPHLQYF